MQSSQPHTPHSGFPRGIVGRVLFWMPVWVPLLLLWQVSVRGLRPALAEHSRLAREEAAVVERHRASRADLEHMQAETLAWSDPIYRERVRRLLTPQTREH